MRNISAREGISYSQNGSFFLFLDQVNEATASANGDFNDTHRDKFPSQLVTLWAAQQAFLFKLTIIENISHKL